MDKILLDTHALIWWALGAKTLSRKVKRLIENDTVGVFVSAASVESYCSSQGFALLAVTFAHAERAGSWPQQHGDPFDRMLAAQSDR